MPTSWEDWAPPLDPPTEGGLPLEDAQAIADLWWETDPHYAAGLMWDAYAGMLAAGPLVSSVNTGAQSVSYQPAADVSEFGAATRKAEWHYSKSGHGAGGLVSLPLSREVPPSGYRSSYGADDEWFWWIDP